MTRCKVCTVKMTGYLREGVRRLLGAENNFEVILLNNGEADAERQLADIMPEVIILQKGRKGYQGIGLDRALEVNPNALVIVFDLAEDFIRLCYGAQVPVGNDRSLAKAIRLRRSYWPEEALGCVERS